MMGLGFWGLFIYYFYYFYYFLGELLCLLDGLCSLFYMMNVAWRGSIVSMKSPTLRKRLLVLNLFVTQKHVVIFFSHGRSVWKDLVCKLHLFFPLFYYFPRDTVIKWQSEIWTPVCQLKPELLAPMLQGQFEVSIGLNHMQLPVFISDLQKWQFHIPNNIIRLN